MIHDIFRTLSDAPEFQNGIDLLESGTIPKSEAEKLARSLTIAAMPVAPAGHRHYRYSFWSKLLFDTAAWKGLYLPEFAPAAELWLLDRERWAKGVWPPPPIFQKID